MKVEVNLEKIKIYRGLKNIAEFLNTSPYMVGRMMDEQDLPVMRDGNIYSLSNISYWEWERKRAGLDGEDKDG